MASFSTDAERSRYIEEMLWKKKHGIPLRHKLYYAPNGERCTIACVKEVHPKMHSSTIHRRLEKWEAGKIDSDGLFELDQDKVEQGKRNYQKYLDSKPKWGGLGRKDRSHKLASIPEPTPLERRLYGSCNA
jgi:hypothetical protein